MNTAPNRGKRAFRAGFTLIEVMIVVVIVSVATTVVLFSLDVTGQQKARTFVKELRFLMHNLSNEAILTGHPHGLQWERKSQTAAPVIYKGNQWSRASDMESVSWRGFAKAVLAIDGVELEEEDGQSEHVVVGEDKTEKNKSANLPEILFWSTGLWEPAGEIRIEIDSLPYVSVVWTAGGRTALQYPDDQI